MLQIKNLNIQHKKDLRTIIEGFNLILNDGDKAVMIGEEGNGKSTIMKWITDPYMIEDYTEATGERLIGNERIGYLPQELPEQDGEKTIYEYFCEEPLFFDKNPKELADLAGRVSLESDFCYGDQKMKSLSGGEKIKAQLLRLLISEPTVLLLDEPSNDIDIETLELLENLINGWKYAVLFISHDETLIENTANMIVHIEQIMKKRKSRYCVVHDAYVSYIKNRMDSFEKQEQEALNDRREKKIRDEKYRKLIQKVEHAQASVSRQEPGIGRLLKKKMHSVKSMGKRFEREDANMTEMPEKEDAIFFTFAEGENGIPAGKTVIEYSLDKLTTPDGSRVLSTDIFLRVKGPEKICIVGTNGCGKTTLLKQIAAELLGRNDIKAQYMPQNYEDVLDLSITPVEFLDSTGDKEIRTRIRTHLGSLKYTTAEMDHPISELSGGQKAKIFLLKMSLSGANVLILDEPTRNFSPLSGPVIRKMLSSFPGAIISISHDRKFISEVCTATYRLTENGLVKEGGRF